jgi:hypothetical protein
METTCRGPSMKLGEIDMWFRVLALLGLGISMTMAAGGWFAMAAVCAALFLEPQKWW